MPGYDGTGPRGMGPMTGGMRGWCPTGAPRAAGYGAYRAPFPAFRRSWSPLGLMRPRFGGRSWFGRPFGGGGRGRGGGGGWGRGRGRW
jgi:hypothetical protein